MPGLAMVCMVILFAVAYTGFSNQKNSIDDLYKQRFSHYKESAVFLSDAAKIHANLYKSLAWVTAGFEEKKVKALADAQLNNLAGQEKHVAELLASGKLNDAEQKGFKQAAAQLKEYAKVAIDVVDIGLSDANYGAILLGTADDKFGVLNKTLNELAALEESQGQESYEFAEQSYDSGLRNFVIVGIVALIVSALLTLFVTRALTKQLGGEPDAAADIANKIAAGDLTVAVHVKPGDSTSLMAAMQTMVAKLSQIISEVRGSADALSTASEQVNATAQSISPGHQRTGRQRGRNQCFH